MGSAHRDHSINLLIRIDKPIKLHVTTWLLFAAIWTFVILLTTKFSTDAAGHPNAFGQWLTSGNPRRGLNWALFGDLAPSILCSIILSYRYAGSWGGAGIIGLLAGLLSFGPMLISKHTLPGETGAFVREIYRSDMGDGAFQICLSTIAGIFGYAPRQGRADVAGRN